MGDTKKKKKTTKKQRAKRRKVMFIVEIVILLILLAAVFVWLKLEKIDYNKLDEDDILMNDLDDSTDEVMGKYTVIALFGLDNRDNGTYESGNSDTIMLASINNDSKEVKLVSIYRDTYLNVKDDTYAKMNSAYQRGGPKQAIEALNTNLDLKITKYVAVDFNALVETIDLIGGVDIDVTPQEVAKINEYSGEVAQVTGKKNTTLSGSGVLHLNGVQATAYARIRKLAGDDYKRTERQRTVIEAMITKVQKSGVTTINSVVDEVFDDISTNITPKQMLSLGSHALSYKMVDNSGFPFELKTKNMGKRGDCVIPLDLETNVIELHEYLFGSDTYTPTDSVKEKSKQIINDTGYTKETRSEERRVGKECRSRWSPYH